GSLNAKEKIQPYSATFRTGTADSVTAPGEGAAELRAWWKGVTDWARTIGRSPATLSEFASNTPNLPMLVALSPSYLRAVEVDLTEARSRLVEADQLIIVSAGSEKTGTLAENFLPCDARLEHLLGGARSSLNARIVRYILRNFEPSKMRISSLRPEFEKLQGTQQPARTFARKKLSDSEIIAFIKDALASNPRDSPSSLLRVLRQSDRACEQHRFRNLFARARNGA